MSLFQKLDLFRCQHNFFLYGILLVATLLAIVFAQVNIPIGQQFPGGGFQGGGVGGFPGGAIPPGGQNIAPGANIPGVPPGGAGGVLFTGTGTNPFYGGRNLGINFLFTLRLRINVDFF
jgi:hypothetical protein